MITGANTNVRYRGRVFHVQTEDSGRANPRILSHIYFGGTILATQRSGYADLLEPGGADGEQLEKEVRARIEAQHKDLLKRLKAGEFDATIAERLGDTASSLPSTEPGEDIPATAPQFDSASDAGGDSASAASVPGSEPPAEERAFGDGIVSQKPLDEVILDYLVEKARRRTKG